MALASLVFAPDNLSPPRAEYRRVVDAGLPIDAAGLSATLKEFYGLDADPQRLETFQGANVTSWNLRLRSDCAYNVKVRPRKLKAATGAECETHARLHRLGAPVPAVVANVRGQLITEADRVVVAVYEFVEGSYFTGSFDQWVAAGRLFSALSSVDRSDGGGRASRELEIRGIVSKAADHAACEPADLALLEKTVRRISPQLVALPLVEKPLHLDFHPLNVIFPDHDPPVALDFEHFRQSSAAVGLGFACYKFSRERIAKLGPRILPGVRDETRVWTEAWNARNADAWVPAGRAVLGTGAAIRVFELLGLITGEIDRGERRFEYDLAKQLRSLVEIDAIFFGHR